MRFGFGFKGFSELESRRNVEKLSALHDLNLFNLNTIHDNNLDSDNCMSSQQLRSQYYSPHIVSN